MEFLSLLLSEVDKFLEGNEDLHMTINPSPLRMDFLTKHTFSAVLTLVIAGLISVVDSEMLPGGMQPMWLSVLFVVPAALFFKEEVKRHSIMYHFTDEKFIEERGIFSKDFSTVPYARITKVRVNQSFNDRLMGIGNLEIEIMGTDSDEIHVNGIRNPQQFRMKLDGFREDAPDTILEETEDGGAQPAQQSPHTGPLTKEDLEAELGRIERRRTQLEESYENGEVGEREYRQRWYRLDGEERAIQRQLDQLGSTGTGEQE